MHIGSFQSECQLAGTAALGLSGIYGAAEETWSAIGNLASIGQCSYSSIGFNAINHYGISELNTLAIAAIVKTDETNYGISLNYFGLNGYSESSIGLSLGRSFKKISFGFKGKVDLNSQAGLSSNKAVSLDFASSFRYYDNFSVSLIGINLLKAKFDQSDKELLKSYYIISFSLKRSEQLNFFLEGQHSLNTNTTTLKAGLKYLINEKWESYIGASSEGNLLGIGLERKMKILNSGIALNYHDYLGISSSISICYKL